MDVGIGMAFGAGIFSFFSPCVLPLFVPYISYITGLSYEEIAKQPEHLIRRVGFSSLFFILGFSVCFVALGAGLSFVGEIFSFRIDIIKKIAGVLIIIFGVHLTGIIKIGFFDRTKRISFIRRPATLLGSFIVGISFALAWTPCVGPILGTILAYATTTADLKKGIILLSSYSLGLGIPFFVCALLVNKIMWIFKRIGFLLKIISIAAGLVLIIFGIVILSDYFGEFQNFFFKLFPFRGYYV